ncbi:MAG TPA: hypothetical protein VK831_02060 [Candidatus Deferrimicrobiaceae bacterium]|nr:hypothetical protein [Candidatus Deferrimicrobiaceae bacterium]
MVGSGLRDREDIALDLVGVAGLTALAAGLVLLAPSEELGFDAGAAVSGMLGQLSTTVPAAVAVAAVAVFDLAAGLTVARLARRTPFASLGEAITWATVGAVLKNVVLLGLLGGLGLFRAPVLWVVDGALVAPLAGEAVRRVRSVDRSAVRPGALRDRLAAVGSLPLAALAGAVWVGPLILQLASPVVPFLDVLPNHVAPAEHLRAFGAFDPLTATQSPIYGPSRSLLGYVAWLGALTTMSGLPAVLAISAFIVPSAILVAVGLHALARSIAGPELRLWPWVLLAFALTTSFARLGDVRGTVVVLPFACAGLALAADRLSRPAAAPDPWWPGSGTAIGLALGMAILVHPVIGALAAATLALVGMARPAALAVDGPIAGVVTTVVAGPQLATMLGIALPAWTLAAAPVLAIAAGAALGPVARSPRWRVRLELLVARLPIVLLGALAALVVLVLLTLPELLGGAKPESLLAAGELAFEAVQVLLVVLVAGWVLGSPAARSPIVILGALAGIGTAVATQLIPGDAGLLARTLRFELPKTLYYWIPVGIAVGAGATLALVRSSPRLPWVARPLLLGLCVVVAALPLRPEPIDALHLGERRWSEALAFDLRAAATGYWRGYPDSRQILDGPRRQLVDVVRGEIEAGRLGPDVGVLHVARTFQQWDATPLGVFAGVTETTVSPDAEFSIHTVGGRLHRLDDLDALLASGTFGYVLLEPSDVLPGDVRDRILGAGYVPIFENERGELFAG